jgi:hypothetical protein
MSGRAKWRCRETTVGEIQLTVSGLTAESWDKIREEGKCYLLNQAEELDEECTVIKAKENWRKGEGWKARREQSTLSGQSSCADQNSSASAQRTV